MSETRPERDPEADLRPSDRLVLRVVRNAGGSISQRDLVARSGLPPSTASEAVSRLREAGLVESHVDPTNAICRTVSLSE